VDEEGTLERLKTHLCELIDPKIGEHRGRIVKTTGDGLLAEFASVVDAVRCASEIQSTMADRDLDLADDRRLRFRIGINLGDVIADGDDIYGDDVNIAARLEALAEPGSICVSSTVRDHIGDRLPYAFTDKGEQSVKNIARPVRVYSLSPEGTGSPAAIMSSTASSSPPAAAPRLSIVVLPFANLSNDPEQQYFADGITEDLTTDLSRVADLLVISRNTAFTYRNKSVDTKQIGRELGVRYVLEGSVRRSGNQVRVNVQLIGAEIDAHLWAERFDSDTGNLFTLQNEITARIGNTLGVELIRAEAARPTSDPDALDYILRGRAAFAKGFARENYVAAISLYERALALDSSSVGAQSSLAVTLISRVLEGMTDSREADLARAEGLINQVLAANPHNPAAHFAKGQLLRGQGRYEEATTEYETALASNRNSAVAFLNIGRCRYLTGSLDEAIPLMEQAVRLSPRDPSIGAWYSSIGTVHLLQSRTDEAIPWLEKARMADPGRPHVHAWLASAYALIGETDRAAAKLAEAQRLSSDNEYSSIARLNATRRWGVPKVLALHEATYFAGLRKAGMPEE